MEQAQVGWLDDSPEIDGICRIAGVKTMRNTAGLYWILLVALLSSCSKQPPSHNSPIGTTTDVHQGTAPEKSSEGLPRVTAEWYEVVSQQPGPEVTDVTMRRKIEESGQPWKGAASSRS